jgi:(p)ppGpp synthase/HD superfamily hydrolase
MIKPMHTYHIKTSDYTQKQSHNLETLAQEAHQLKKQNKIKTKIHDSHNVEIFNPDVLENKIVENAFQLAIKHHKNQKRKCQKRPYIEHPFRVCTIVTEIDPHPTLQAAALGHDLLEDTHCSPNTISEWCSPEVLEIIHSVSEEKALPNWFFKKEKYIVSVQNGGINAQKICIADKIANLESLKRHHREEGDMVWETFTKDRDAKQWFEYKVLNMLKNENNIEKKWIEQYESMLKEIYG